MDNCISRNYLVLSFLPLSLCWPTSRIRSPLEETHGGFDPDRWRTPPGYYCRTQLSSEVGDHGSNPWRLVVPYKFDFALTVLREVGPNVH